jgi:tetraacyldisaccharide 4'-kinase
VSRLPEDPLQHPLRQALWPLGCLYGCVAAVRNLLFDRGLKTVRRLEVPVVSIGNLTVGGTGKTPTVLWLSQLARDRGRRPGVLARGYGRAEGALLNDEGLMLQRRLPWLLQRQDPDRVAAGQQLVADGADFVILDDGMQHRRLHRDVDVVCLDAVLPFGNGQCLPAGDLREFCSGLRRADVVLLTRADLLPSDQLAARIVRIRQLARRSDLPVHATCHRPSDLLRRPADESLPLEWLRGRQVVLLSAIARPQSFRQTVESLGADVLADHRYRDHHRFSAREVELVSRAAADAGAVLLTTEKDDARLADDGPERCVLRIGLDFPDGPPPASEVGL